MARRYGTFDESQDSTNTPTASSFATEDAVSQVQTWSTASHSVIIKVDYSNLTAMRQLILNIFLLDYNHFYVCRRSWCAKTRETAQKSSASVLRDYNTGHSSKGNPFFVAVFTQRDIGIIHSQYNKQEQSLGNISTVSCHMWNVRVCWSKYKLADCWSYIHKEHVNMGCWVRV